MMRAKRNVYSWRFGVLLGLCLMVGGCKETLYSGLSENEANEMLAELVAAGFEPSRTRDEDGVYELRIAEEHLAAAVTVLRRAGYPKQKFETLGDVFAAEGLFGNPFEQQTRFIHAMNQELSRTVSLIQGVHSARVLVTAPPRGRFDRQPPRATASVTVHHDPEVDVRGHVSSIKMIVAHSLENLDYDDVAVVLFPTGGPVVVSAGADGIEGADASSPIRGASLVSLGSGIGAIRPERLIDVAILLGVLLAAVIVRRLVSRRSS